MKAPTRMEIAGWSLLSILPVILEHRARPLEYPTLGYASVLAGMSIAAGRVSCSWRTGLRAMAALTFANIMIVAIINVDLPSGLNAPLLTNFIPLPLESKPYLVSMITPEHAVVVFGGWFFFISAVSVRCVFYNDQFEMGLKAVFRSTAIAIALLMLHVFIAPSRLKWESEESSLLRNIATFYSVLLIFPAFYIALFADKVDTRKPAGD